MINPFQSILNAADVSPQPNGLQSFAGKDKNSLVKRTVVPASSTIETGLIEAQETIDRARVVGLPAKHRKPLVGGKYFPEEAIEALNSHFLVGKNNQETAIFRINLDGTLTFMPSDQFKLEVQNIVVRLPGSNKCVPAEKFWRENPKRLQRTLVFKPGGRVASHEFNLWHGFAIKPRHGWQKQRRLLRHIREVICRRNKDKFKYLMRLLAWMVQHPGEHSGVILTLKSRKQGTGKTTLGNVMLDIFGAHGARIDDKDRLLGRFNDFLETTCFVLLEEATWAGDLRTADKLKSLVTGDTLQIERKFGTCRQVPNRLKSLATTNHDHAVSAGVSDRRNVVFDVGDERAGDRAWFGVLHQDLADGGKGEFLHLLQSLKLGSWHPREILKTVETAEQQRMSGDGVSQWSQACIDADAIVGTAPGPRGIDATLDLAAPHSAEALREAYNGFCKQNGIRPMSSEAFGRACTEMFGPRKRLKALQVAGMGGRKRRPWGYPVPNGKKWQEKVDARLGIKC